MKQFKRAKVVMLPTNEKTKYLMVYSNVEKTKGKLILNGLKNDEYKEHQHLYIISDDEIKEGDWCYDKRPDENGDLVDVVYQVKNIEFELRTSTEKKIIATTDASLIIESEYESIDLGKQYKYFPLPQPSQQFIEKYIEEYNKGNIITDVLVEYELISNEEYFGNTVNPGDDVPYFDEKLKINPKDNTITIKKVKDSYSREEVIEFGNKVKEYCKNGWKLDSLHMVFFEWDKWIEENL